MLPQGSGQRDALKCSQRYARGDPAAPGLCRYITADRLFGVGAGVDTNLREYYCSDEPVPDGERGPPSNGSTRPLTLGVALALALSRNIYGTGML